MMEFTPDYAADGTRLVGVVRGVRNRWRLKRVLRGASIVVAVGFVLLALSAFALDALRYGETAVVVFRVVAALLVAALAGYFVVLPLLPARAPKDDRVALYLEEHEPSLEGSVLTAIEVSARRGERASSSILSPILAKHLVQNAIARARTVDDGRHVDERDIRFTGALLAGIVGAALLVTVLGPPTLRHGLRLLL